MDQKSAMHELIIGAFKELLMHRDFDKITVKMIAAQAGITRSRFYNYFQDKYELIEWIIQHQIADTVVALIDDEQYPQALRMTFSCVNQDKEFFARAFRIQGQNGFAEVMERIFTDAFVRVYKSIPFDYGNKVITRENIANYQALALLMYLRMWLCDGRYGDATWEEISDAYVFMITQGHSMINPMMLLDAIAEKMSGQLPDSIRQLFTQN